VGWLKFELDTKRYIALKSTPEEQEKGAGTLTLEDLNVQIDPIQLTTKKKKKKIRERGARRKRLTQPTQSGVSKSDGGTCGSNYLSARKTVS